MQVVDFKPDMKKTIRIAVLLFIVLYSFLSEQYHGNVPSCTDYSEGRSARDHAYAATFSATDDGYTSQPEELTAGSGSIPAPSLKNQVNDYSLYQYAAEFFLLNQFARYLFYSVNIPLDFPKTDIIFPFHYFW